MSAVRQRIVEIHYYLQDAFPLLGKMLVHSPYCPLWMMVASCYWMKRTMSAWPDLLSCSMQNYCLWTCLSRRKQQHAPIDSELEYYSLTYSMGLYKIVSDCNVTYCNILMRRRVEPWSSQSREGQSRCCYLLIVTYLIRRFLFHFARRKSHRRFGQPYHCPFLCCHHCAAFLRLLGEIIVNALSVACIDKYYRGTIVTASLSSFIKASHFLRIPYYYLTLNQRFKFIMQCDYRCSNSWFSQLKTTDAQLSNSRAFYLFKKLDY